MTTLYSELATRFPTSEALFTWMRSPEGGALRIDESKMTPAAPLALIYYDKTTSDMTLPHVGAFRSVVWNTLTNRPVCVSPERGLKLDDAPADLSLDDAVVEDFVDGVMINMFWDGTTWRLATRTQLDAGGSYYGKRSFADLFWETFANVGVALEEFATNCCYSWVLQHPDERVVVPCEYGIPRLWLVQTTGGAGHKFVPALHSNLTSVAAVKERVAAWGRRFGYKWQGLIVKLPNGQRFKARSAEYTEARWLRGNQAKRTYLWLERWAEGKLPAYLSLYPEESHDANALIAQFKGVTQEVFDLYQAVYRRKEMPLGSVSRKYRKLLWEVNQAHAGSYFPTLRAFMNKQDTARKLWLCTYEQRYGSTTEDAAVTV